VWQPRFYDFNVYSHEKKKEKLDFFTCDRKAVNMHANPVNRGLLRGFHREPQADCLCDSN
jgi:hypothetical protein